MAFDGDALWASAGSYIIKYIRGKEVGALKLLTLDDTQVYVIGTQVTRSTRTEHFLDHGIWSPNIGAVRRWASSRRLGHRDLRTQWNNHFSS